MTTRHLDGFDYYRDLSQVYDDYENASIIAQGGRYGTDGASLTNIGYIRKTFDNQHGWIVGAGYYGTAVPDGGDFITVSSGSDAGGRQVGLSLNSTGNLLVTSSGSTLLTTTKVILPSTWYYVELKVVLNSASTGTAEIHVNGNGWGSATGVTASSGSLADTIFIKGAGAPRIDDLFILDTSGSINNDFWGDMRIESVFPTSDAFYQQWTLSSGSRGWALLDDVPYNVANYISSGSLGQKHDFLMGTPQAGTGSIKAVQMDYLADKNDITLRQNRPFIRLPSAVDYPGDTNTMTSTPIYYKQIWENRPDNVSWNTTTFGEAQFGVEEVQ